MKVYSRKFKKSKTEINDLGLDDLGLITIRFREHSYL